MSNFSENLRKYIPFEEKKYRKYQGEAVDDIIQAFQDDNNFVLLNAPVGAGKSVLGYLVGKYFEEQGEKVYFATGTKILQNQYAKDFQDVKTIRGRANFMCGAEDFLSCSNGMCQSMSNFKCDRRPILKAEWQYDDQILPDRPVCINDSIEECFYGDPEFNRTFLSGMCPYWKQKVSGIMSPMTMLNYDYLITDLQFVQHLPRRSLLVADEAHNIEHILMRQLETSFSPKSVLADVDYTFKESRSISEWSNQANKVADLYSEKIGNTSNPKKKKTMEERYHKFVKLSVLLEDNPSNWVFIKNNIKGNIIYTFKPIMVSEYSHLIFDIAENVLLMTGTVLKQDIFARDLGITDFKYIEIPSIIPSCNRPIIKSYAGSMSRSSIEDTMPNMIAKIKMLAEKHKSEKGVLHTYTYGVSKKIQEFLGHDNRYMFHSSKNKEEVFDDFKADKTNKILVSPVAFEGIDFSYDLARWQCVCKDPFPNLGDIQLSIRDNIDYGYIFRERCRVLSQVYGRCIRGPSDYAVTYLLDSRLESLLGPSTLVTDYFLEGLEDFNYSKELKLQPDAYEKLTPDNSRKKHDFDRMVEKQILDDIKDGYNSLESLRKAYKEFPSDSYKYITPAVERLLKHDAIYYA